ncbi:hypothetical protein ABZ543_13375 [Streptomyces roseifaciens]
MTTGKHEPGSDAGRCADCGRELAWDRTGDRANDKAGEYTCSATLRGHTLEETSMTPDAALAQDEKRLHARIDPTSYAMRTDTQFWSVVGMQEITQQNWKTLHFRLTVLQRFGYLTKDHTDQELAALAYAQIGHKDATARTKTTSQFKNAIWEAHQYDASSAVEGWWKQYKETGV